MSGICKYCDYSGTNEAMIEHAGECPVMCNGDSPPDVKPKIIKVKGSLLLIWTVLFWRQGRKSRCPMLLKR